MTGWFNRRTLAAILLIVGAGMLQGCMYGASSPYPADAGHGHPATAYDRGGEGDGGGGMN